MSLFRRKPQAPRNKDPELIRAEDESARARQIAEFFREQAKAADARTEPIRRRVAAFYEENDVRTKLHQTFGGS